MRASAARPPGEYGQEKEYLDVTCFTEELNPFEALENELQRLGTFLIEIEYAIRWAVAHQLKSTQILSDRSHLIGLALNIAKLEGRLKPRMQVIPEFLKKTEAVSHGKVDDKEWFDFLASFSHDERFDPSDRETLSELLNQMAQYNAASEMGARLCCAARNREVELWGHEGPISRGPSKFGLPAERIDPDVFRNPTHFYLFESIVSDRYNRCWKRSKISAQDIPKHLFSPEQSSCQKPLAAGAEHKRGPGRPMGSGYNDEKHLRRMYELLSSGEAQTPYAAAMIAAADAPGTSVLEHKARRLIKKFSQWLQNNGLENKWL